MAALLRRHPEVKQMDAAALDAALLAGRRATAPFLTHYEKAKVLALRSSQLAQGAAPCVPLPLPPPDGGRAWPAGIAPFGSGDAEADDEYLAIALAELRARALPFILKRPLPDGSYEFVRLKELELL
jgi:DNA-directed RNA polymerase I, II, and III subunit RPABC2